MAKKWNLIVDIERCDNCRSCYIAVKDEHAGNDFPGYAAAQPAQGHHWLDIRRKERGAYPLVEANFQPVMCNHCDDAPCMKAARDGAVQKRADGIVIIDPVKAKGQKQIVDACPYGGCGGTKRRSYRSTGSSTRTCSIAAGTKFGPSRPAPRTSSGPSDLKTPRCSALRSRKVLRSSARNSALGPGCTTKTSI